MDGSDWVELLQCTDSTRDLAKGDLHSLFPFFSPNYFLLPLSGVWANLDQRGKVFRPSSRLCKQLQNS